MVDSQEIKMPQRQQQQQTIYDNEGHEDGTMGDRQVTGDDCEAALLSSIATSELMNLDGDVFPLETYQDVFKFETSELAPAMETDSVPATPALQAVLLDHLKKAPTLEEYHDPMYNFNVDLNGETSGKSSWMFSSRLNKVFVKMGQACTFNLSCQTFTYQQLYVRAMMVCSAPEDLHYPVFRCENHRCSDNSSPPITDAIKTHVMRCFNPTTQYVGNEKGVAFQERLAVIVPVGMTKTENASLNISLQFVCQNSCRIINRRQTAIIFTLEDAAGQILGRRSLNLKVCSCPKRDKQKEEESLGPVKRKSEEELQAPPGKKVAKVSTVHRNPSLTSVERASQKPQLSSPPRGKVAYIKKERSSELSPSSQNNHQRARSLTPLNSQELVEQTATNINIPLPGVPHAVKVTEYAFQLVAADLVRCVDDTQRKHLAAYLTQIRRLQKSLTSGRTATNNSNSSTDSD
ncbi:cellular tumor antigen p53 isoform X2 [Uranotaenia lowii]|nr:cellular tumor antigen p53 isoform X2 [Uranotaenia lowii]